MACAIKETSELIYFEAIGRLAVTQKHLQSLTTKTRKELRWVFITSMRSVYLFLGVFSLMSDLPENK